MYGVKQVAELMDMSVHTVRYYTDIGLIPNVQRDSKGNRMFDEANINWFKGIKRLRSGGMSIESVKRYVELCLEGDSSIPERYDIIKEQLATAERQLEEVSARCEYMRNKLAHYEQIKDKKIADDTNPSQWIKVGD